MRFAGSRIEGLIDNGRTNFGGLAQKAGSLQSDEIAAYNDMQGKVGATGITAAAQAEAAEITGAAAASAANSQATGSMFRTLGGVASSAIGAFGGGGGSSYNTSGPTGFGSAPIQTSGINFFG
jgi:hypothetical protein